MRLAALAGTLLLAACTSLPPATGPAPAREALRHFEMSARFALRTERPNEAPQSASGRLFWRHDQAGDQILLSSPLGQGIAEIAISPAGAELRASDGRVRRAANAAELLASVTGYTLPLTELPAWLLGRPSANGRLESDGAGRPLYLKDSGWRIDYAYDGDDAAAAPARLTIHRDSELELRLRVEEWRTLDDGQ